MASTTTLIVGLPIAYLICFVIDRLSLKYKKRAIFLVWTLVSLVIYGVCACFIFTSEDKSTDLSVWQYIVIFDLASYFIFLIYMACLAVKAKKRVRNDK